MIQRSPQTLRTRISAVLIFKKDFKAGNAAIIMFADDISTLIFTNTRQNHFAAYDLKEMTGNFFI